MRTKHTHRRTARRASGATRTAATTRDRVEGGTIPIQIGSLRGYIAEAGLSNLLDALHSVQGLELSKNTNAKAKRGTPRIETISNRVTVRKAADVDVPSLESTAREKALSFRRALLQNALTVSEARRQLGVGSNQTIHNWIRDKKLLALPDRHRKLIPPWQFDAETRDGIVQGLSSVLHVLSATPFGIAHWLTTKNQHLREMAPIDLLKQGHIKQVLDEARGVGLGQ